MKVALVTFHQIDVGSQELGTTNEHMISRVHADVEIGPGFKSVPISIDVKQTVGSTFDRENVEVIGGNGGPDFDPIAFQRAVASYYLDLLGPLQPGSMVLMQKVILSRDVSVSVPLVDREGGGW